MTSVNSFAGFFDLQVNGYKGIDFSSPDLQDDEFVHCIKELRKTGTVGFLPTMITSSPAVYERNLKLMNAVKRHKEFADLVPGFHIEGPFISPDDGYRGVHRKEFVRAPDIAFVKKLQSWSDGSIRLLTMASELKNAVTLCRYLSESGIAVSMGHQHAGAKEVINLASAGATAVTHLGNGIPHLIHRHNNPIWASLADDRLQAMVVADGFHLPLEMLKTVIKVKGLQRTILVSDLSPVAGLKPGLHSLWGHTVKLDKNGFLHDPESGYLAASSFTLLDAANYMLKNKLLSIAAIKRVSFLNPLKLVGLSPSRYRSSQGILVQKGKFIPAR